MNHSHEFIAIPKITCGQEFNKRKERKGNGGEKGKEKEWKRKKGEERREKDGGWGRWGIEKRIKCNTLGLCFQAAQFHQEQRIFFD